MKGKPGSEAAAALRQQWSQAGLSFQGQAPGSVAGEELGGLLEGKRNPWSRWKAQNGIPPWGPSPISLVFL